MPTLIIFLGSGERDVRSLLTGSACFILFFVSQIAVHLAAQNSYAQVEGVVRDPAGKPVSGASVRLQELAQPSAFEAKTNEAGAFAFTAIAAGNYRLTVNKPSFCNANEDAIHLSPAEKKHYELVLQPSGPSSSIEDFANEIRLDDRPNFTIAGVTDSTGSGGHGSETRLRTGEVLAKEMLKLKDGPNDISAVSPIPASDNSVRENQLRSALQNDPRSFRANHELGDLYFHAERYRDAVPLLDEAYHANPRDHGNAVELVSAMFASGQVAQAGDRAKQMLASKKGLSRQEAADFHRLLGDIEEKSNDPLKAVHEYERAAELDATEQNYFAWGSELLLHGAAAAAVEAFGKGTRLHPESARMLEGWGAALFTTGSAEEGTQRLCEASDLNPADAAPYLFLGKIQEENPASLGCAEAKLARFAESEPGNALANYYYALALWKADRGSGNEEAVQRSKALLVKAIGIDPKLDVAFLQLGNLYFVDDKVPEAVAEYQKAIAANPESSEAHYRLGLAYKKLGDQTRAQSEFEQYKQVEKSEAEKIEWQRRELRQFVFVLKDRPGSHLSGTSSASGERKPQ